MPRTLFISDLHLADERPAANEAFRRFMRETVPGADALYVLGDLFEYWIGDEDLDQALPAAVAASFRETVEQGTPVYLMVGNRDFLLGERFLQASRATVLPDPVLIRLYATPTLLTHGDLLCTGDVEYLKYRAVVRDPAVQASFLAKPREQRPLLVEGARRESETRKSAKPAEIMDVAPEAVEQLLRERGYPRLIHGHTHRPARHVHLVDGQACERWVLPDWYEQGGYLAVTPEGIERRPLSPGAEEPVASA